MSARGFFVTGTDTGVGKTLASCALIAALRTSGHRVGAMKPIETGVGPGGPLDALALQAASASESALDDICPQRFALPAAPCVAAASEGRAVELDRVMEAYARIAAQHDLVVVEGAGGLLVPTEPHATMADLARALDLPLLLVARASLGTINHTLLTLEAIERRGLTLAGVILSHATGPLSSADRQNLGYLRECIADRIVGELPPLSPSQSPPAEAIDLTRLAAHLSE